MANLSTILAELKAERTRLDQAIAALTSLDGSSEPRTKATKARGRRNLSAEARARIAAAQRARWAKQKKAAKS
jgi:hypothetical protein